MNFQKISKTNPIAYKLPTRGYRSKSFSSLFFLKFASILHCANLDLAIKSYLYFSLEDKDSKEKKVELKFRQAAKQNVLVFITWQYF